MATITHTGSYNAILIGDLNNENVFLGGWGQNFLLGGNQNDTFQLKGDRFTDFIDGGAGRDVVDLSNLWGVRVDLGTGVVSQYMDVGVNDLSGDYDNGAMYVWQEVAILGNIEDVIGTIFNDTIVGNWADNTIEGGDGADVINGAGGNDTTSYEHSYAGVAVDLGGSWSPLNDAHGPLGWGLGGHADGDVLLSIENVIGSDYNDWFSGNAADNVFDGRGGLDRVSYRDAEEGVTIDLQTGIVQGGQSVGTDTLISIEYVEGSRYNDTVIASDRADVFVFGDEIGHDTITGFNADNASGNHDVINLQGVFGSWEELSQNLTQDGDLWAIIVDENESITLTNIQGTLDANDFYFG